MGVFSEKDVGAWFSRLSTQPGEKASLPLDRVHSYLGTQGLNKFWPLAELTSPRPAKFSAHTIDIETGRIAMRSAILTTVNARRSPQRIESDGSDAIVALMPTTTTIFVSQREKSVEVAPGHIGYLRADRPFSLRLSGVVEFVSLMVPAQLLSLGRHPMPAALTSDASALSSALTSFMREYIFANTVDPGVQHEDDEPAIVDLVRASILQCLQRHGSGLLDHRSLRDRVDELIERHHAKPDFDVDSIATILHLSRRQLYRHFEDSGEGIATILAERRLQSAVHLLEVQPPLSISEITSRAGFANANTLRAHFMRRFRVTPSEYRSEDLAPAG